HAGGRLRGDHRGQFRRARRGGMRGRRPPPGAGRQADPGVAGRPQHGNVRVHEAAQAALQLGNPMSTPMGTAREQAARDHLWMHFARQGAGAPPIIVRVGHGRRELAEAAARQAAELAYFPLWSYAHPAAIDLAERIAHYAPGDLNRVFFTSGGGEAVEAAWKLAKQYFKLVGKPLKSKVISRSIAYHGTTQGALAITGVTDYREPFEPLVPGAFKVPNTNAYRAPHDLADKAFGLWAADRVEEAILAEGADTVAAVFVEPVQNAGGCFPPPPGYFELLREICTRHDVLLVSDEVICAFGRI